MIANLAYPTIATARVAQKWGNANARLYPGGRHMGLDIAAAVGSPIFAAANGLVETVSLVNLHGYGRHVIIQHDGFKTLYAHLHKVNLYEGQAVLGGYQLGEMGGDPTDSDPIDGASSGPHLHFEVILPAQPQGDFVKTFAGWTVDPIPYLMNRFAPPPKYKLRVLAQKGVRVHTEPNVDSPVIGAMPNQEEYQAMEIREVDGDAWARLWSLREEWAATTYHGEKLMQVDALPNPQPLPQGEGEPLDERAIRLDEIQRMIALLEQRKSELA